MQHPLSDLPATAGLICTPADPALSPDQAADLTAAIAKLFSQFEREGNVTDWACEVTNGGRFLLTAWLGQGEGLSGCRKDKIHKVLALHAERSGSDLLAPLPIWLANEGQSQGHTPAAFKDAIAAGTVSDDTPGWDTMAADLDTWRRHAGAPISSIPWLAARLERVRRRLAR